MQTIRRLARILIVAAICETLLIVAAPAQAQQTATVTATGAIDNPNAPADLTLTFPPAGGPVAGTFSIIGNEFLSGTSGSFMGSFDGGDGGKASGTWGVNLEGSGNSAGSWEGNFYANGTGSGTMTAETATGDVTAHAGRQAAWHVTFSAQEFQAGLAPTITSEYIYSTYGIRVEDSFGNDGYAAKAWSQQELTLLNDVLRELPPGFRKKLALTSIIRSQTSVDESGNLHPSIRGAYSACDRSKPHVPCDPATDATIRIFDSAYDPALFTGDPEGSKAFKAAILHELAHAVQYHREDSRSPIRPLQIDKSGYVSPLMQNYMDATSPITDINDPDFWVDNGWVTLPNGTWQLISAPGNRAPSAYGEKNPKEDMAEAVRLYVYDPQALKSQSLKRYDFVRDQIFGGIEYEDGHQK